MSAPCAPHVAAVARVLLLLLLAACSGEGAPTPPPPPPSSGIPASVAISTGDNQQAEPGRALPVLPAVTVRDAAGRALSGVQVSFSVDSGGGTVSANTAITSSDGVASAGTWTIGPLEGRNIVSARVGSLPPARFVATGVFPSIELVDVSIAPSGGNVVVSQTGSPLNGLRLEIPPGAFSVDVNFKVGSASSFRLPRPAGALVAGPLLTVETDADLSNAPLTLRIPASIDTTGFPVVAIVDTLEGALEVLPTLEFDATSVTATLRSFEVPAVSAAAEQATSRASMLSTSRLVGPPKKVRFAVYVLPANALNGDVDTGFRPGTDDWEFPELVTSYYNSPGSGMIVSERWYYRGVRRKGLPLHGRIQQARGVQESNPSGIRWSSIVAEKFDRLAQPSMLAAKSQQQTNKARYDANTLKSIVSAMVLTGAPQIMALSGIDPLFPGGRYDDKAVLAYRWERGALFFADPSLPGNANTRVGLTPQGMTPYVEGNFSYGLPVGGLNGLIPDAPLATDWPKVIAGTIGQHHFPSLTRHSWDPIIGDTLFMLGDTSRFWFSCNRSQGARPSPAGCPAGYPTTLPVGLHLLQPQGPVFQGLPGGWVLFPSARTFEGVPLDLMTLNRPSVNLWADVLLGVSTSTRLLITDPLFSPSHGYHNWLALRVIKYGLSVGRVTGTQGSPVTMTVQTLGGPPIPPQASVSWNFNDGTPKVVSTNLSVNHVFAKAGAYPIEVELLHANGTVIGRTRTSAVIDLPLAVWRLDSAGVSTSGKITSPAQVDTVYYNHVVRAMNALAVAPGDNHVLVSGGIAMLQQVPAGQGGSVRGPISPPNAIHFGLADPQDSFTMGPIGNGVLSGEFWIGTDPLDPAFYHLKNTIAATMTPGFLRGTLTVMAWKDTTNGVVLYTVNFRARQVVP